MPNHLAGETSPYLLQHVNNPVDWHPWGQPALALALSQHKPILLSVGYSACHWCHVMAHECFEDAEVAAAMNQHFINIKVDREERPDLDQIYQTAHHMLTQRNGGWPLTMFLTPDQKPFFGGTYFPKVSRHNLPGFLDLLPRVAAFYHSHGAEIEQQNASLLAALADSLPAKNLTGLAFSEQPLSQALLELKAMFDPVHGGFGDAPKFPHPAELEFCLSQTTADARKMATHTLAKMAQGGLYDQLGGGFCRYSTDQTWSIPHFEKMLYDNGPLLRLNADAWLATGDELFQRVTEETAAWIMREMQSPAGGYYSTLDADSEHEEGKFYVWNREQVAQILSPDEYAVVAPHYGLSRPPNFENRHWHLEIIQPLAEVAQALGINQEEAQQKLAAACRKLFAERESRVHPGRDEKILTSWNGLMIKGMAHAGRVCGRTEWVRSATSAVDFIRTTLWQNHRLLATCKDDKAHLNAYLDDYAFLLDALLELMQAEFRQLDLDFAVALAEVLLEQFEDRQAGGFFFTGHDHEQLIHRPKPGHDNATPSGNSVAATALQRLGHLLGEQRYLQAGERALALFYPAMTRHASSFCSLLTTLEETLTPPRIVVLRGQAPAMREWGEALLRSFPRALVLALPSTLADLPPTLNQPAPTDATVNAWVCQGVKCLPEITDLRELLRVCELG